jgi:signal transduction histidine kinase/ActR/RegA family two-component response regulator
VIRARFRSLPIRRKLVAMTAASTAAALLLSGGGFLVWDIIAFRDVIERDVESQARILGENSAAPLVFNDERAAGETLAALELRPRVRMGCLYRANGQLFATYHRDRTTTCPPLPAFGEVIAWREATFTVPVTYAGTAMGTLHIARDLTDVQERLIVGFMAVTGLIVLCTMVALLIGARLQRSIVEPMLRLADTARLVSEGNEQGHRVTPTSNDEVGVVMTAFNNMLDRIEARTAELSSTNAELQREIIERTRVEAERTVLLARERDANRLKDEFLATLSHELRTPLNAVLGWTRVLRSTAVSESTQTRALESIERNARAQARLIEDLLEVSRIVTGKLRLQVRPADLATIVDSAVEVVSPAAAAKRITLREEVDIRPAMTSGDADRLQQVVWNLLSNAVKFTPQGGEVSIALRHGNGFTITVKDTGIGIDPSFLPHIFEPFRQADGSTSREHGGLGLGLAIVRQIVELHGGTVAARSGGSGLGAMFQVHLPSEIPHEQMTVKLDTTARALPPSSVDTQLLDGIRVLIVDDEEDARELLRTTLEGYGATVTMAPDAAKAMDALESSVPDVIVSDIGMAGEDGYTLIRRVRRRAAQLGGLVPAVAVTAYASPTDRLAALAAGFQAHVAKPYEPSEVASLVERLARGAATR